ncbi:hypothetical protein DAEQUDRAFT_90125 [Daedalea quercina L-15889]|uniref:Uncharacterized protein n=1 Tax=Daedalea quercina L-15889 TaxID=1314783 RepID=A0A165S7V9_9APHY|nr:hypothetical protein DAEQUDRAFT_90125 [Daedalea quercina L-15889]
MIGWLVHAPYPLPVFSPFISICAHRAHFHSLLIHGSLYISPSTCYPHLAALSPSLGLLVLLLMSRLFLVLPFAVAYVLYRVSPPPRLFVVSFTAGIICSRALRTTSGYLASSPSSPLLLSSPLYMLVPCLSPSSLAPPEYAIQHCQCRFV